MELFVYTYSLLLNEFQINVSLPYAHDAQTGSGLALSLDNMLLDELINTF
jgi:hypothetical protein